MNSVLPATYNYSLNGLEIFSELHLPELSPNLVPVANCNARFRIANIPEATFSGNENWVTEEPDFQNVYLNIPGVARYHIKDGKEILVHIIPGADEKEIRLFLLGSALGILMHQRGILPLHASVININGSGVAFVGESGAGKSTIAAFFQKSGYQVICDDVCALMVNENGRPVIWPGVPRIKLWSDALSALGHNSETLVQDSNQDDKFHLSLNDSINTPLDLACIYQLNEVQNSQAVTVDNLTGQEKLHALVSNIYRGEVVNSAEVRNRNFLQCATVANKVGISRLSRAKNFQLMDKCLNMLKRHWPISHDDFSSSGNKQKAGA